MIALQLEMLKFLFPQCSSAVYTTYQSEITGQNSTQVSSDACRVSQLWSGIMTASLADVSWAGLAYRFWPSAHDADGMYHELALARNYTLP